MRLTYDANGYGQARAVSPYPSLGTVDFPDPVGLTPALLFQQIAADPARYTVAGPVGARQLLDRGVPVAAEESELAVVASVAGRTGAVVLAEADIANLTTDLGRVTALSLVLGG
jgi:hypothetical protein